jgi:CRISPR-associated endonuclease/helicase Cas3
MEKSLPSSNLYSHPEKFLEVHLKNVAWLMESFLNEKPTSIKNELLPIARIIGLSHDLGKATRSFQKYLFADKEEKRKLKTQHSLFSAICTYYLVKELNPENKLLPLFAYIAVRRHHGDLIDVLDEISWFDKKEDAELLLTQLNDINDLAFDILVEHLLAHGLPRKLSKNLVKEWIENFSKELRGFRRVLRKSSDIKNYVYLNILYSLLIDADKTDAIIGNFEPLRRKDFEDQDWVKNYLKTLTQKQTFVNQLRQKAFKEVDNQSLNLNQKFYSINLPTGLGKTLTGFSFALKLKNKLKTVYSLKPRIIYSLPFLSIIDQNAEVLEEVIRTNGITPTSDLILKHHHLSDIYYETKEEIYEGDLAEAFIEGWNADIVVTTFVQLFHTLLSNKNSALRRFHKLSNSIIILDEIQVIPIKYWRIIREILKTMAELLNSYIIVMTATEPMILEKDKLKPLVMAKEYYGYLNRVNILSRVKEKTTLLQLKEDLKEEIIKPEQTLLFIFNTISSAREFYYLLNDLSLPKTYLSTHIVPKERLKRIDEIRKRKYKVVVSTQLVEAGVDIDFDMVIRDIAPLDCIVQSAGRCNRHANDKIGIVKVYKLIDDKERCYATRIYDPVLVEITEKLLSQKGLFNETNIYQLLDKYYNLVLDRVSQTESQEIWEAILKLKYCRKENDGLSITDFKLIEEDYPKIDVFIEYNEDAKKVWEEFQRIRQNKNFFERKNEFLKIRKDFYSYIVSVPIFIENYPPKIDEIYYVPLSQLEEYYDSETGFKVKPELAIW